MFQFLLTGLQSPEASLSDYQSVYHGFRELVKQLDEDSKMGSLQRYGFIVAVVINSKTNWNFLTVN
ncbi:hypothetical protein DPMN_151230 [Dreissena polymorpha]|uniref:Uncharacterized protein n=1 Tax=Dreissena polymorpha TaxID=45954 RepID=A0A9D4J2S1_DREPO|nr:hypothetical protein DPMN_151230 [Dreissena polymorpha]